MNHATNGRVRIVTPYVECGRIRYTPTMREVFARAGFDHNGFPAPKVWAEGWKHESEILNRAERKALGFEP